MKKKSASQSAFFKFRVLVAVLLCFAAITLVLFAFGKASAQPKPAGTNPQPVIQGPVSRRDAGGEVRYLAAVAQHEAVACKAMYELRENEEEGPIPLGPVGRVVRDPVVQRVLGKIGIPGPIVSFDGQQQPVWLLAA